LATLGFGLTPSEEQALNNYLVLESNQSDEDRRLMQSAVDAIVQASLQQVQRFKSQELNNLACKLYGKMQEEARKYSWAAKNPC